MQGRSVELGGPFLCTMGYDTTKSSGASAAFGFCDGFEMEPKAKYYSDGNIGGFSIFDLKNRDFREDNKGIAQGYSKKRYDDILLSFKKRDDCDICVRPRGSGVSIKGPNRSGKKKGWYFFDLDNERVGVLALPLESIYDPFELYNCIPTPSMEIDHHIVVYHSRETPTSEHKVLAMARLRAIEHRVAVAVLAGPLKEVMKTNNYRNIQRFRPENDLYGLDFSNLGGALTAGGSAIPGELYEEYLKLSDQ